MLIQLNYEPEDPDCYPKLHSRVFISATDIRVCIEDKGSSLIEMHTLVDDVLMNDLG